MHARKYDLEKKCNDPILSSSQVAIFSIISKVETAKDIHLQCSIRWKVKILKNQKLKR